jgi:hypothetical protein
MHAMHELLDAPRQQVRETRGDAYQEQPSIDVLVPCEAGLRATGRADGIRSSEDRHAARRHLPKRRIEALRDVRGEKRAKALEAEVDADRDREQHPQPAEPG